MPLGSIEQKWQAQQGIYWNSWMEKRIFGTFTFDYSPDLATAAVESFCTFVFLPAAGVHWEWVVNVCFWQIVMHHSPNLQPGFYDGSRVVAGW